MKTIAALFVPFFALWAGTAQAQEPTEPAKAAENAPATPPETGPASDNALFTEPPSLVPESSPNDTDLSEDKAPQRKQRKHPESSDTELIRKRVLFREAKTKALKDPRLHELLAEAEACKTDPEKRVVLRKYYKMLYDRMAQIDPSIVPFIEQHRRESLNRLSQDRLRELGQDPRLP